MALFRESQVVSKEEMDQLGITVEELHQSVNQLGDMIVVINDTTSDMEIGVSGMVFKSWWTVASGSVWIYSCEGFWGTEKSVIVYFAYQGKEIPVSYSPRRMHLVSRTLTKKAKLNKLFKAVKIVREVYDRFSPYVEQ